MNNIIRDILNDIKVELADEFDRNFERKGFFGQSWRPRKFESKGTILMQTGNLRRSIRAKVSGNVVIFSSSLPYAAIHNEGGTITVTAKMKKYFWAKYAEAERNKKSKHVTGAASFYKAMALKKIGSKIEIPERRFIGWSPEVEQACETIIVEAWKDAAAKIADEIH